MKVMEETALVWESFLPFSSLIVRGNLFQAYSVLSLSWCLSCQLTLSNTGCRLKLASDIESISWGFFPLALQKSRAVEVLLVKNQIQPSPFADLAMRAANVFSVCLYPSPPSILDTLELQLYQSSCQFRHLHQSWIPLLGPSPRAC